MPNMLDVVKGWLPWVPDYNTAPPTNRDVTVAYAPLARKLADGTTVPVGTFLPEHYVLANAGSLRCQVLEKEWKTEREGKKLPVTVADLKKGRSDLYQALYREENNEAVRMSAFELAICPSHKQRAVGHYIEKEYQFRRDRDLPLPAMISKFRVGPDFLKNISDAGLLLKEHPGNCKVNIINPTPTRREKIFHYLAQYSSYLVTISAALGSIEVMMGLGVGAPWLLALGVGATYLAKKTGNDFGLYDVAEGLLRDLGWLTNKDLIKGKLSLFNTIGTGIYMAAIASAVFFAVTATFGGSLALPWAFVAAKTSIGAGVIAAAQYGFAGFFAGIAGLGTLLGTAATIRYFWGLSVYDNQITLDKKVADAIPTISTAKDFKASLAKQQEKLLAKLDKPKYGFSEDERTKLKGEIKANYLGWQNRFGAHPVVAEEAKKAEPRRSPRKNSPAK